MAPSPARALSSRSHMDDCYAWEMDRLHRRWLPPEIFVDIGIADAAPPSPVVIEDIAVQLAGLLSGSGDKEAPRSTSPPGAASDHHRAQVCGLEGRVLVAYGGGSNGGGATAPRPFLPHSPVQWQIPNNLVNGGGVGWVLDPRLAPLLPCRGSPPAKLRGGGTGVFFPRAGVYQGKAAATKSPAIDGIPPKERLIKQQQQQQQRGQEATEMKQQRQNKMGAQMVQQQRQNAAAALHACPELALPQEWTY